MFRHVYVRFRPDSSICGLSASFEPRKWIRCLTAYGIYPDGWDKTCLDRRVHACGRSEFPDSLNLRLFASERHIQADIEQIRLSVTGAVEVQIFEPSDLTPPMALTIRHSQRSMARRNLALRTIAVA